MRDAERRLLRCIGGIDDELILEADYLRFPPKHWGRLLALAACLALVLAVPAFLNSSKGGPEAGPGYEQAESPENSNKFAGTEGVGGENVGTESPDKEQTFSSAEILKTESIGGLKLGMTEQEVLGILGPADFTKTTDRSDGAKQISWLYSFDAGEDDANTYLQFVDTGNGCFLNKVFVTSGSPLALSTDIQTGSSAEDIEAAYPSATLSRKITTDGGEDHFHDTYSVDNGLRFGVSNGVCLSITLGPLLLESDTTIQLDDHAISLGGLTPGMTQDQVRDLLGEPDLATQAVDSDQPQRWSYESLTVNFHDFDGTVREIRAFPGCGLSLSNGIGFDSTAEDVARLYPDAYVTEADLDEDKYDTAYEVYPGDWTLTIGTLNGTVAAIILEDLSDPMLKALTVPEITIYQWIDKQWHTTTVIDKAAKGICTVLTISEPEEATGIKNGIPTWMDFGNGTVVELMGENRAAVWTHEGVFDPVKTDGMTWHLTGVFQGLDDYVAQALENPTATWDDSPISELTYNPDPIVATESIAGLKLGMSDREVRDILGKPYQTVSLDHNDGLLEMWLYDGISLVVFSMGDGWFLNEIYPSESGYTLSSGIGIGSAAEEVEAAYPGIIGQEDLVWDYVYSTNEDLSGLYLAMSDGQVSSIMFGPWVLDFVMESSPEESPEEEPELEP